MVPETLVFNELVWLIAQEDFINISYCESSVIIHHKNYNSGHNSLWLSMSIPAKSQK
jgi:hypothetical protein